MARGALAQAIHGPTKAKQGLKKPLIAVFLRFTRGFNEPGAIQASFPERILSLPMAEKQGF